MFLSAVASPTPLISHAIGGFFSGLIITRSGVRPHMSQSSAQTNGDENNSAQMANFHLPFNLFVTRASSSSDRFESVLRFMILRIPKFFSFLRASVPTCLCASYFDYLFSLT